MAKKNNTIACKAIKELIEVTVRTRQDAKRAKELREEAKQEALELYKAKHWEVGTDQTFEGVTIRLYHEKVYSWEKNHQIKDALVDIYCSQLEHIEWLENQIKKTREELKMTCHNLELAYPNSESIKYEPRFQIR